MKSKEAIRNMILKYTNQIWGTRKVERLDSFIQVMIATLTNELYLTQNKLNDLETTLPEKIAMYLSPEKYISIRPAHTLLQMKTPEPIFYLDRTNIFSLNWLPEGFELKADDGIAFHPVTDVRLFNLDAEYLFYHKTLYDIKDGFVKKPVFEAHSQPYENAIWIGLNIEQHIDNLEGLTFYLNFPNYSEIDDLYEVLAYTECYIGDKKIRAKHGFPIYNKDTCTNIDFEVLELYNDHYITIDESVTIRNIQQDPMPKDLRSLFDAEKITTLLPVYWVKFVFPAYFTFEHLSNLSIAVNTFPVSNKKLATQTIVRDNLSSMNILHANPGEKLLFIESMIDNRGRKLIEETEADDRSIGIFQTEISSCSFIEEVDLIDSIEQLEDMMDEERSVFSNINKELVTNISDALEKKKDTSSSKTDMNDRIKSEVVSKVSVKPFDHTAFVKVDYWLTLGDYIGYVPTGKMFDADKSGRLDGLAAISLTEVTGAKEFIDVEDLMSINKYIFTSRDRIITEHNIIVFCESELGKAVERVEITLDGKVSPRPNEGIIRVIKIYLAPSSIWPQLLYKSGVLKSLKTRLKRRSPSEFVYDIIIKDNSR